MVYMNVSFKDIHLPPIRMQNLINSGQNSPSKIAVKKEGHVQIAHMRNCS